MFKTLLAVAITITLSLVLAPAVADDQKKTGAVVENATATTQAESDTSDGEVSVMDQPVDFSTPEAVEDSIEKVREEAGDAEANRLKNALGYILTYDLSIGRDKEKMYKKLNGRTPNAIIAKMKR